MSPIVTFSILQVLISSVVIHGRATNCEKEQQKCGMEGIYLKTHHLLSAVTEKELQAACNASVEYMRCMTDYTQKCGHPGDIQGMQLDFLPMRRLVKTVCTPENPFIPRFLNYTACYSKFSKEYDVCSYDFIRGEERVMKSSASATSKQQNICCYFAYFQHCARATLKSKCGVAVADTGEDVIKLLLGKEFENMCSVYQNGSAQCSFMYSAKVSSASPAPFPIPVTEQPNECDWSQKCLMDFEYLKSHVILRVVTETELTNMCRFTIDAMSCLKRHIEKCGTTPEISKAMETFSEIQELIDSLCKPGDPFRQRYLEFTTCYPNFSALLKACEEFFSENQKIVMQMEMSDDQRTAKFCCGFESLSRCSRTAMESKCGKEIANTGVKVFGILEGNNTVTSYCSDLKGRNPECPSTYRNRISSTNSSVVTALMTTTSGSTASTTKPVVNTQLPLKSTAAHLGYFPNFYVLVFLCVTSLYY